MSATVDRQASCKERVRGELKAEIKTLRKLWELAKNDPDASDPDEGTFYEHGLCFDYVAAGTFEDQDEGYFRYQISWGGPSDEFLFYTDAQGHCYKVEYWFKDWFDGASITLSGSDKALLIEIFEDFKECGSVTKALEDAQG